MQAEWAILEELKVEGRVISAKACSHELIDSIVERLNALRAQKIPWDRTNLRTKLKSLRYGEKKNSSAQQALLPGRGPGQKFALGHSCNTGPRKAKPRLHEAPGGQLAIEGAGGPEASVEAEAEKAGRGLCTELHPIS